MPQNLDDYLRQALDRMGGDPDKAAGMFLAWTERDSDVRSTLPELVTAFVRERAAALSQEA